MLKDFLKINKIKQCGIIEIIFLLALFCLLSFVFIGHQGSIIIDCGREAYIPSAILKGEVLYKDIFNVYGPLSYQLNALLYLILGENLSTLYQAGIFTSIITLSTIFLLSKTFTSNAISAAVTFFIMATCVFNVYIFNYIFPYSFAMSYALCGFLLSILFFVIYIKDKKEIFIPLSTFFAGFSIASKYDFLSYALFLTLFVLFLFWNKSISKKCILYSILSFLSIPLICLATLFYQGLNWNDLSNYVLSIKKMLSTDSLKFFYSHFTGLYPSFKTIKLNLIYFFKTGFCLSALFILIYVVKTIKKHHFSNKLELNVIRWILIVLILLGIWGGIGSIFNCVTDYNAYSWLPITNSIIFLGFIIYYSKILFSTKIKSLALIKEFVNNIDTKDKLFALLTFVGILSSIKSFYFLNINIYGPFMLPTVLITNIIFITEYLPRILVFLDKKIWRNTVLTVLIIISTLFTLKHTNIALSAKNYKLETSKGYIYTHKELYDSHSKLIEYIEKNTAKDDKILVLPEGPMLNFLTERESNNKYHSLIPLYVETFGEKNIIKELKENPPNYIFINTRHSGDYGKAYICRDYGQNLCKFISQNYSFKIQVGKTFKTAVYKIRP